MRLGTRMLFVFRDSAHIPVSLSKLGIANQSLAMAIGVLCGKDGARDGAGWKRLSPHHLSPQKSYEESEWLYASRQLNLRRRASAVTMRQTEEAERPASRLSSAATIVEDGEEANSALYTDRDGSLQVPVIACEEVSTNVAVSDPATPIERRPCAEKARSRSWLEFQAQHRW